MKELKFQYLDNTESADIYILPIPLEKTVSYKQGTAYAPEAILEASNQLEYYEEDEKWCPLDYMTIQVAPMFDCDSDDMPALHQKLTETVKNIPKDNLLIGLGGEHAITPSLIQGRIDEPVSVIFLDAHADLREQYQGSIYSHACPAYRLWKDKHDLYLIGVRSIYKKEAELIEKEENIRLYTDREVHRNFPKLLEDLQKLKGPVWLSIDMDAFDPALVAGVGTPQPGGIHWFHALDILYAVIFNKNINLIGLDIVELVPDANKVSEMVAAKLVQKAISFWGKSKQFQL